jgi:hypothetical protein
VLSCWKQDGEVIAPLSACPDLPGSLFTFRTSMISRMIPPGSLMNVRELPFALTVTSGRACQPSTWKVFLTIFCIVDCGINP